ncbi:MAG TPA: hypothetical protein VIR03_01370 [Candidatus Saccharimonadales bacterium]
MKDNIILRLVYTFFVGILLAFFVGVGISTFYEAPKAPAYPSELNYAKTNITEQQKTVQKAYDEKNQQHQASRKLYSRNVSIMALVAAVLLFIISVALERKISVLADGMMLGGVFTLLYSIGRGVASENNKYLFVAVTVGLVAALILGYCHFATPEKPRTAKTKR